MRPVDGFACVNELVVRFADCDALGHVNNAKYFTYLEETRFHWFREVFGPDAFRKHPIILADARCSFRASAKPGDRLRIGIRVERIGRSSFTHRYRIEGEGGRLIAEAETVGVGFDYARSATRELGDEFRRAVLAHQGSIP